MRASLIRRNKRVMVLALARFATQSGEKPRQAFGGTRPRKGELSRLSMRIEVLRLALECLAAVVVALFLLW